MVLGSNIQASRIGRGIFWKNIWFPNKLKFYKKYLVHDFLLKDYISSKMYGESSLKEFNFQYNYIYDYSIQKSFDKMIFIIKKFNVEYSKTSYSMYLMQMGFFQLIKKYNIETRNFFFLNILGLRGILNLRYFPLFFYYNGYLVNSNFEGFQELKFKKKSNFSVDFSLIIFKKFILKKNIFFNINFLQSVNLTFKNFSGKYFPLNIFQVDSKLIKKDNLGMAAFLFNPQLLLKFPNLILFYQNWLHNSWLINKKIVLKSFLNPQIKLNQSYLIEITMEMIYSFYCKFVFLLQKYNYFFYKNTNITVNGDDLLEQKKLFEFQIQIGNILSKLLNNLWGYIKSYLKYFSYENGVYLFKGKILFNGLGLFGKMVANILHGYTYSSKSFLIFFGNFFSFIFKGSTFIKSIIIYLFNNSKILDFWFAGVIGIFSGTIVYLKIILVGLKGQKLKFFEKLNLIYYIFNHFFSKGKIFLTLVLTSILNDNKFFLLNLQNYFLSKFKSSFFLNFFIVFLILTSNVSSNFINNLNLFKKLNSKFFASKRLFICGGFFNDEFSFFIKSSKIYQLNGVITGILNFRFLLEEIGWLLYVIIPPKILLIFFNYIGYKGGKGKMFFFYFFFCLANLTMKLFFGIFGDLLNLFDFNSIFHFLMIYWQKFFFYYFYMLKVIKITYQLVNSTLPTLISGPLKFLFQKNKNNTTLFDLFSYSLKFFYPTIKLFLYGKMLKNRKLNFTLLDFANVLVLIGNPNFWKPNLENLLLNGFSYIFNNSLFSIFFPFFSIKYINRFFFGQKHKIFSLTSGNALFKIPYFSSGILTYIGINFFTALNINANMLAIFIKKKLQAGNYFMEIIGTLSKLLEKTTGIGGFLFLLKGRFTGGEGADKIWLGKGILKQTKFYKKIDYKEMSVPMDFGVAVIRIWLLVDDYIDDVGAII